MHVLDPLTADDERALAAVLVEHFGVRVSAVRRLGGELDINYHAVGDLPGADRFVRLSPEPVEPTAFAWQNAVLAQLVRTPLPVAAPVPQPSLAGNISVPFAAADGRAFRVRVTTWLRGRSVAELGAVDASYRRQLGELAARVPLSLAALHGQHAGQNEHHWMAVRAGQSIRETISAVTDLDRRGMVSEALRRFEVIDSQLDDLPTAVVHQDLHDFNLLAERDAAGRTRITGIVDFNDAVVTARIAEVAIAAVYAALRQVDAFGAFSEVVAGYVEAAVAAGTPPSDAELAVLYPLAVARLAVNGSTWTMRGCEGNREYAESRMTATWPALEQLLQVTPERAEWVFRNFTAAS
ncbi:phosphotransferase [Leucobacter musarum]|uniref:phosphotransferase n=1 Tax=Leucobacter musarum TaxID=1930747 RepID=UPI0006A7C3D2|nr:phosphotransferase [Leucobacter musarum]